jgi:murein DD-endopeptidase MepM/ murein hydrolase activator NlpD
MLKLGKFILLLLCGLLLASATNPPEPELCGKPPLQNLHSHQVKAGETLESIARKYQLHPNTIMGLNPSTRSGQVRVGEMLKIPPFDGVVHRLADEDTYRSIAQKYRIRADVLFERNGCQVKPEVVYVPGVLWQAEPSLSPTTHNPTVVETGGYPLPFPVPVTSGYGWRIHPITGEMAFHGGIDLGAPAGTPVLATSAGKVDYAGMAGTYGNLVELRHGNHQATRYAHLSVIDVTLGQKVVKGQRIGLVGSTGRSTGPHLHYEILLASPHGWLTTDPAPYLERVALKP